MTKEEFEKLKADEMRAYLAERGIKVASKATKAAMVEALVAATTSAGQIESPEPSETRPSETSDDRPFTEKDAREQAGGVDLTGPGYESEIPHPSCKNAPAWPTPQPPPAPEPQPRAPLNRKQRRRLAALNEKRADRKMRALDLRG